MKSLCLVMPTRNRAACVKFYIETLLPLMERYPIELVVYDSSDGSETEDVVQAFAHPHIHYDRYLQHGTVNAIDHKVYTAYRKYCDTADYLWFTSDGAVLQLEKNYEQLQALFARDYDLIVTDCLDCPEQESTAYSDVSALVRDCFWFMTLLSSGISSRRFAHALAAHFPWQETACNNFWIPCTYYKELLQGDYTVYHYANPRIYVPNPQRTDSFWKEQKNVLWQWSTYYADSIDALPPALAGEKEPVITSHEAHHKMFSLKGLLRLKENGNLTVAKVRENQTRLTQVSNTPAWVFYLLAVCPIRGALTAARWVYRKRKRNGDAER